MALKIKDTEDATNVVYEYVPFQSSVPNPPPGLPINFPTYTYVGTKVIKTPAPPPIEMPESKLPRCVNYYADYGGCGFWRMIWPEYVLNAKQKAVVTGLTAMITQPNVYYKAKAVRIQRQATDIQKTFIQLLHEYKYKEGFRVIYEIDDIVFNEDIPQYNRCKEAFVDSNLRQNIQEIMQSVDEITVTCQFMKDYYISKTGNKNITVVPNYPPKFWLKHFYSRQNVIDNYLKNKKKPRILYSGSGTHIDILNRAEGRDDFFHVTDAIIKARKDFQFVFKGCYPYALKPFIDSGEIEYVEWDNLFEYPEGIQKINANACFAPLADNIFNKSKSNIKMIESGALGIPGTFQDLCTYEKADLKFTSGSDLIDQLKNITKDEDTFMKYSDSAKAYVDTMWLEDHINEWEAVYLTDINSKERLELAPNLVKINS